MKSESGAIRELGSVRKEIDRLHETLVVLIRDRIQLALAAADSRTAHGQALRDVFWSLIELSQGAVAAGRGR